jgi:hypothetical protein
MSTPVKTLLMDAIGFALNGIILLKEVNRGQAIPTAEEIAKYPVAFYFDEIEDKKARNRIAQKSFDLVIQVWVLAKKLATLEAQLDEIDAECERVILTDPAIRLAAGAVEILPMSADKLYIDDGRAILQAIYRVSYAHAWTDPYDPGTRA